MFSFMKLLRGKLGKWHFRAAEKKNLLEGNTLKAH
jgi:hypothetical protein